jgi:hypothetical protein
LLLVHTADKSTWPSTRDAWQQALGPRIVTIDVKHGDHYLVNQPELVTFSAETIAAWVERHVA